MPVKFNPFTGQLQIDEKGSGGGSSYIDGEVQNFSALPQTVGSPAVDSAYLVREAEGTWLLNRKPAGIYIRTANTGVRASDWTYAGEFPDVFNDANLVVYNNTDSTKNVKFDASAIATGTTRTLTVPNASGTIQLTGHAASHASSGSDPLAPSDIGAQSIFDTASSSASVSGVPLQLTAARARTWTLENSHSNRDVYLPVTGIQTGDVAVLIGGGTVAYTLTVKVPAAGGAAIIDPENTPSGSPVVISATGQQYRFIVTNPANFNPWRFVAVDTHTHAASAITSGTLTHERGGLEADVSAYNGLVKISGGSTSAVGIGTGSTEVASGDHTHGNLTNDGKIGSTAGLPLVTTTAGAVTTLALGTAGQVLTVNSGATGVEFAAASGGGVSAVNSTLADILSVSGSDLVADDLGADKLYGWDDSASKAIGFTIGSGLSVSGDTLSATASGGSKTYAVFSAEHNQPPSTAFATLDTRNSIAVLDFDDATDESAVFVSIIPEGASLGSGLKIRLHWMATTATSGNVVWDVSLERMTTDLDSDSFDTIASGTAAANGTSGILTVTEITLTTIDSVTAGDGFRLKVTRDANNASDTMTGDAELVVCEVRSAA